jgi:hypothetical protein
MNWATIFILQQLNICFYKKNQNLNLYSISIWEVGTLCVVGRFSFSLFSCRLRELKIIKKLSQGKKSRLLLLASRMVICYQNCSDLLWEKKLFWWLRKTFEIWGWRQRICKIFGSLKAVYYTVIVHNFNLQEKTTSTVDEYNKSVYYRKMSQPKIVIELTHHKHSCFL